MPLELEVNREHITDRRRSTFQPAGAGDVDDDGELQGGRRNMWGV